MCSSKDSNTKALSFVIKGEEHEAYHQTYEKSLNDDMISTTKSALSRVSLKGKEIIHSMTKTSLQRLKIPNPNHPDKSRIGILSESTSLRFKSKCPHVSLKCSFFDVMDKGWLVKKFDACSNHRILLNNYSSLSLLKYDVINFSFAVEHDVLHFKDDFIGAFTQLEHLSPALIAYSSYKTKEIRVEDFVTRNRISVYRLPADSQTTSLCARTSQLAAGFEDSSVAIFDIRSGKNCFQKNFLKESDYNPVISIERQGEFLLCTLKDSVNVIDVRNFGKDFWHSERTINYETGVNVAKFYKESGNDLVAFSKVGQKEIELFDLGKMKVKSRKFKLKRKLLAMASNMKDEELAVLEGSEQLLVGFHGKEKGTYGDQIVVRSDCTDIGFNLGNNSLLTLGTKYCQIYNFENSQMIDYFDRSVNLNR